MISLAARPTPRITSPANGSPLDSLRGRRGDIFQSALDAGSRFRQTKPLRLISKTTSEFEMAKKAASGFEYVEPIGDRVLVRKDEPKRETKGGIALPDAAEIPTITGRIVTISAAVAHDEDVPLRQYDKILFHPKNAIPVDLEHDNQLFVVPVEDVVAVFRRQPPPSE